MYRHHGYSFDSFDEPWLGTYTPEAYYRMKLQIDPENAERVTREACYESGTSIYNPLNQNTPTVAFQFTPITKEEKEKAIERHRQSQIEFNLIREKYETEQRLEKIKNSFGYKLYKFFGGK
jgi:type IV secretory pathway component VirB8